MRYLSEVIRANSEYRPINYQYICIYEWHLIYIFLGMHRMSVLQPDISQFTGVNLLAAIVTNAGIQESDRLVLQNIITF